MSLNIRFEYGLTNRLVQNNQEYTDIYPLLLSFSNCDTDNNTSELKFLVEVLHRHIEERERGCREGG